MSLERYEIKDKIGEGGAGYVYLAEDKRLGREVAIKRLLPNNESGEWDDDTVDSMLKEAKMLSTFSHPNIVTIYDADIDEDGPYVVMEVLQGRNIDELIEEKPMSTQDFERFATHCLEALSAAHSRDIIHRDIKPNNIVLNWFSKNKFQAKLLDFGTAKQSAVPSKQTVDHGDSVMGSIYFMAPEQFERTELDGRTDIYAMGAVFYYTLTGEYPFTGETAAAVMTSHLEHRVNDLGEVRKDIPEWLGNWVMWLINRNMDDRPASAEEALDNFLANDAAVPLRTYDPSKPVAKQEPAKEAQVNPQPSQQPANKLAPQNSGSKLNTGSPAVKTNEPAGAEAQAATSTQTSYQPAKPQSAEKKKSATPLIITLIALLLGGLGAAAYFFRDQLPF